MLSILIVNWNTRELLRACLTSIANHPPAEPFEVIVVDNASTDGSAEMVREVAGSERWALIDGEGVRCSVFGVRPDGAAIPATLTEDSSALSTPNTEHLTPNTPRPPLHLIASPTNTGYARGNNLAFAAACGDFLLTLNPDTEFVDHSLDTALAILRSRSDVGVVGVRQVTPDGDTQHSVRGFPSVRGILGDLLNIKAWDSYRMSRFDYDREQEAPQPMGTFLLFKREALASVGDSRQPFDEGFPIFFNEVDLLYRLRQKGWKCIYTPRAKILHHGGESTKQVRKSMIWESHRSLVRYFQKHYGTGISRLGLPLLAALSYTAAFIRAKGYHAGFRT